MNSDSFIVNINNDPMLSDYTGHGGYYNPAHTHNVDTSGFDLNVGTSNTMPGICISNMENHQTHDQHPVEASIPSVQQTLPTSIPIIVQAPTYVPDKSVSKFSGLISEDGSKFLSEFTSFLLLSNIEETSKKAVAAFHLHLKGPALIWFNNLPDSSKTSFSDVKHLFCRDYCSTDDPVLVAEEAVFQKMTLQMSDTLEDFHSRVLQKGKRLGKSDRDIMTKYIDALPEKLSFFVRAGRAHNLHDALQASKIGEAHGYRFHTTSQTEVVAAMNRNTIGDSLQSQLDKLIEREPKERK